jgi:quaternary ammonium compound-resistance protein SugE
MNWLLLLLAGLMEIVWAVGLKYTQGFTRPGPTAITAGALILSFIFLGLSMRTLPIGTAYAVWTGIGTIGTVILGIYLFNEPANAARILCAGLILAGIVGLKIESLLRGEA